jgi:multidrug efflux system outer membrane protein
MRYLTRCIFLPLVAMALFSCAVGPDYRRPAVEAPAGWRELSGDSHAVINEQWWTVFGDEQLDRIIQIALAENKDVQIAAARIEEARALVAATRADQFPQLNVEAGASRSRGSAAATQAPPGTNLTASRYRVAADLSFELDLWGRLRRSTEAARATLLSTEYAERVVRLALVSQVAQSYFDLRSLDLQLGIATRTLKTRRETLRLVRKRFEGGVVSELDLQQAEGEAATAEAAVPALERRIVQRENELSVLLGRNPGAISRGRDLFDVAVPDVPVSLPSDLLGRRPDILSAEQTLVAANANIGVARAAYFPRISLTGLLGVESVELSNLFSREARAWQLATNLAAPIFTAGRTRGQVQAATARQRQALYDYLRTIQTAFREVEDSLVARRTFSEQQQAQNSQVQALRRSLRLAQLRYVNGYSSFLEVLEAQRALFNAELQLVEVQQSRFAATIDLIKALGGGW